MTCIADIATPAPGHGLRYQLPLDTLVKPGRATVERLAKSQVFRIEEGVQRIASSVQAMLRSGDIEASHVDAAERWYRDYVMGVVGARDPEARKSGRAPDIHAAMLARTAACG
ncbi:hypothetical protein [Rhizosaccharibacter radicis]|uniref:Uncharacterized protein n=1 Tax=Rhizosaccharibacter radicis TaxID=2782605 RepID=A0ABT1W1M2_9PROT|nr:hypothetical protein [Acetobacteraceae bacterium KSS12]